MHPILGDGGRVDASMDEEAPWKEVRGRRKEVRRRYKAWVKGRQRRIDMMWTGRQCRVVVRSRWKAREVRRERERRERMGLGPVQRRLGWVVDEGGGGVEWEVWTHEEDDCEGMGLGIFRLRASRKKSKGHGQRPTFSVVETGAV